MSDPFIPHPVEDVVEPKPKRKPGRPKGAAQQNYLTLRYWFNQMQENMKDCKPYQRALLSTKMMQTLLAHDKHLESDKRAPREKEVDEASLLAQLESNPGNEPNA